MSDLIKIMRRDDQELVQLIIAYLQGDESETIQFKLRRQCNKYKIACNERYKLIQPNNIDSFYNDSITSLLDELSIGGFQLHLMSAEQAQKLKYTNCYVWDGAKLVFIPSKGNITDVILADSQLFAEGVYVLKTYHEKTTLDIISGETLKPDVTKTLTLHLFAKQVKALITKNMANGHSSPTPDLLSDSYLNSPNLYDVLEKLSAQHPRLKRLLDHIHEAKPAHNWPLYFMIAAGITAGVGLIYYLKENFSLVRAWVERVVPVIYRLFGNTVYLLRHTPLIGILTQSIPLLQSWYKAIKDGSFTDLHKLTRLFLKTIVYGLPIVGYVLCFLAAGVMTIPALGMFITGALIDVADTLYTLIHDEITRSNNPLPPSTDYYSEVANVEADNLRDRGRFVFGMNFLKTILVAASVLIWCMFPHVLIIALSCVVFAWLVETGINLYLARTEKENADMLQEKIHDIHENRYISPQPTTEPKPSPRTFADVVTEHTKKREQQALHEEGYKQGYRACRDEYERHGLFRKSSSSSDATNNVPDLSAQNDNECQDPNGSRFHAAGRRNSN